MVRVIDAVSTATTDTFAAAKPRTVMHGPFVCPAASLPSADPTGFAEPLVLHHAPDEGVVEIALSILSRLAGPVMLALVIGGIVKLLL